jgi:hypothetical protein
MGKRILLVVFLLSFFALFVFAGGASAAKKPSTSLEKASVVYPTVDGSEALPSFGPTPVVYEGGKASDCFAIHPDPLVVIIQHDEWGQTWYDYQKNGSMGRMIAVGPGGQREMAFMRLQTPFYPPSGRYVGYNCKNAVGAWCGVKNVDGGTNINAGYTNISAMHDAREAVIYHKAGSLMPWYTTLAVGDPGQACSNGNTFAKKYDIPDSLGGAATPNAMWPKMTIVYDATENRDYFHIVGTHGISSGGNQEIGYTRCYLIPGDTLYCEMPLGQPNVASPIKCPANVKVPNKWIAWFGEVPGMSGQYTNTISVVAVTSPVSKKVALVWTNKRETGTGQYNNDVCYTESDSNGIKWFPQYGGQWPPTLANGLLHYVTNYATTDMERAYTDVAACYDYEDNLHVAWTAAWYDSVAGTISVRDANLMHWSQATGTSMVAPGYWGGTNPGAWNRNISKMSISAKDPIYHGGGDSTYLFCTWTQFDSGDVSLAEWSNGDIYAAASSDSGRTWTPGFNLTGTKTPDCDSSDCLSEHWSSLAVNMYDGDLHIEYVCDKDAGGIIQEAGSAWTLNPMMYMHVQQLPASAHCGATFINQDPPSWTTPPLKIPPTGSRIISFQLKGIYNKSGNYEVTTGDARVQVTLNPSGNLAPAQTIPVEVTIFCSGQALIETYVTITTCKNTVDQKTINMPLFAVCSNDYYECMRDDATKLEKDNGVCSLWVCANTEEMVWDKRLTKDSNQVIFTAGVIAAFMSGSTPIVGRQDYRDTRTGARDTIKTVQDYLPAEPDCNIQKVYVTKTYIWYPPLIPAYPVYYWVTINKQIILFHDRPGHTCPEWKKEQVIKHVWINWNRYPAWWPSPGSYTGHPDIYYGVFADVDAPFDTGCHAMGGEAQSGCNAAGWDNVNKIVWQSGFSKGVSHPEYLNYYVGLALTNTSGAIVTPWGCKDVRNSEYLYPNSGWGWQDSQLYRLATTPLNPATVVDNPDSVIDRSVVLTAGKIPVSTNPNDTTWQGEFILIEALIRTGLDDLKTHIIATRGTLIPELTSAGVFSKIFPICGDANNDGKADVNDVVYLINYLFVAGSPAPPWPMNRADANGDNKVDVNDVVYLINYLFVAGSPPPDCSGFGL